MSDKNSNSIALSEWCPNQIHIQSYSLNFHSSSLYAVCIVCIYHYSIDKWTCPRQKRQLRDWGKSKLGRAEYWGKNSVIISRYNGMCSYGLNNCVWQKTDLALLFVSSASNQRPSESKSLSRIENRQPQQPYPVNTERENWFEDNMCLTRHQLSEPDDTDLHSKNMKDITFCDRNIMGKFREILTEI